MRNEDQKIQAAMTMGSAEEQISKLLGSLKRIDAPGDFNFRVKSRIANGKPTTAATSWLPGSVRLAMPLGLLLLVGGYFAFDAAYSTGNYSVPVVAEVALTTPAVVVPIPDTSDKDDLIRPPTQTVAVASDVKPVEIRERARTVPSVKRLPRPAPAADRGGGSIDSAVREGKTIFPVGVDPSAGAPAKPIEIDSPAPITVKDALELIGVSAAFDGRGWKVSSVAPNSVAGRSGVKAGDVIEALNGQALSEKTSFASGFAAKNLRVLRDGRAMIVALRP